MRLRYCYFCTNGIKNIDYKEVEILSRFMSEWGGILSAKRTGTCRKHQRKLNQAIERARFMALLPYTAI